MLDIKVSGFNRAKRALEKLPQKAKFSIKCPACSKSLKKVSLEDLNGLKKVYCENCRENIEIKVKQGE